jgi:hypothetical protein
MDLESELVPGMGKSLGFRHGNDKQMAIQIVAGGRVFVCDNMSLYCSMVVLKAKHTWGFNLDQRITLGLERWEKGVVVVRRGGCCGKLANQYRGKHVNRRKDRPKKRSTMNRVFKRCF